MKIYKPKEFAAMVGVTVRTLQRWDKVATLPAKRTCSGRRYYTDADLIKVLGTTEKEVS